MENINRIFEEHPIRGKTRWFNLILALLLVYVVLIGGAQIFWFFFAGNFSTMLAELTFVLSSLIAVRVLGERYSSRHVR